MAPKKPSTQSKLPSDQLAAARRRKASWTFEESWARHHFYTMSTDGNGHLRNGRIISMPPQIHGRVSELVASPNFPAYRTFSDFARDAIVHRLHDLAEMSDNDDLHQYVSTIALAQAIIDAKQQAADLVSIIESLNELASPTLDLSPDTLVSHLDTFSRLAEDFDEQPRVKVLAVISQIRQRLVGRS